MIQEINILTNCIFTYLIVVDKIINYYRWEW